jgi:hypothetical protein
MGIYSDIGTAKGTEGGVYFKPGIYRAQIQRCKQTETRKGKPFFVAEFKILQSNNPERPVGSSVSFMVMFDLSDKEMFRLQQGNVADFMRPGLAAYAKQKKGVTLKPEEVQLDEPTADTISGVENLLAGVIVDVEAFNKPTKAGTDFTHHRWSVPGDIQATA